MATVQLSPLHLSILRHRTRFVRLRTAEQDHPPQDITLVADNRSRHAVSLHGNVSELLHPTAPSGLLVRLSVIEHSFAPRVVRLLPDGIAGDTRERAVRVLLLLCCRGLARCRSGHGRMESQLPMQVKYLDPLSCL